MQKKLSETGKQDLKEANESLTKELIAEVTKPVQPVTKVPELVWVKVRNVQDPGNPIGPFFYEDLAAGIPRTSYTFLHDKVHKTPIPREVFNMINEAKHPINKIVQTEYGPRHQPDGYKYLYQAIEVKKPE